MEFPFRKDSYRNNRRCLSKVYEGDEHDSYQYNIPKTSGPDNGEHQGWRIWRNGGSASNGDAGVESLEGKANKLVAVCEEIKNFPRVKALNISDDELFDLVAECVDVRTYRLDACFTKMAHSMIRNGADYILGAYGWVLDLKEDKAEPISDEYIIAPSITHAKTAAVLRSAYAKSQRGDSHKDVDNNTLAINLSARRVRIAKRIIDGVKSGLAIGAILGADLERSIHEEMLDVCILPLRKKFTLLSSRLNTDGTTSASSNLNTGNTKEDSKNYALAVINGTKLINALNEIKIKGDVDNILTLRQYFTRNDKEWQAFVNGIDGLRQTLNGKERDMLKSSLWTWRTAMMRLPMW